jgi:hypothetical protein
VEGGDSEAIGNEIYLRKTPGCDTYGDVEVEVMPPDPYLGDPPPISFFRPAYVQVYVQVSVKRRAGYVDALADEIRQRVSDFINALDIGEDVSVSLLQATAQAVAPNLYSPVFTLSPTTPILLGTDAGNLEEADIGIDFNAAAQCTPDNVGLVYI